MRCKVLDISHINLITFYRRFRCCKTAVVFRNLKKSTGYKSTTSGSLSEVPCISGVYSMILGYDLVIR